MNPWLTIALAWFAPAITFFVIVAAEWIDEKVHGAWESHVEDALALSRDDMELWEREVSS